MAIKTIKVQPFENHKFGCSKCSLVDVEKQNTLINCCIEGAPLLKDYLAEINSKEYKAKMKSLKKQFTTDADGKSYKTTTSKLKAMTVFK